MLLLMCKAVSPRWGGKHSNSPLLHTHTAKEEHTDAHQASIDDKHGGSSARDAFWRRRHSLGPTSDRRGHPMPELTPTTVTWPRVVAAMTCCGSTTGMPWTGR